MHGSLVCSLLHFYAYGYCQLVDGFDEDTCMYSHACVRMRVSMLMKYVHVSMCMYPCTCIYVYVSMYMYVCMYARCKGVNEQVTYLGKDALILDNVFIGSD